MWLGSHDLRDIGSARRSGASRPHRKRRLPLLSHELLPVECASQRAPLPRRQFRAFVYDADAEPPASGAVSRADWNVEGDHGGIGVPVFADDRDDYSYSQDTEPLIGRMLGGMWSPYDGTEFESLRESDIEHIVAISEAHDSGLCATHVLCAADSQTTSIT